MPRYYDPSYSDPVLRFADWLSGLFQETFKTLDPEQIEQLVRAIDGKEFDVKPKVVLRRNCTRGHYFFDTENCMNKYFPASYSFKDEKICMSNALIL